jgi:hypothetical protein
LLPNKKKHVTNKKLQHKKDFTVKLLLLCLFMCNLQAFAQELSGQELLKKSTYHDPTMQ